VVRQKSGKIAEVREKSWKMPVVQAVCTAYEMQFELSRKVMEFDAREFGANLTVAAMFFLSYHLPSVL